MNLEPASAAYVPESVMIIDGDILSRHAIAHYLRHCGYSVVEAANTHEAYVALDEPIMSIDVILFDLVGQGSEKAFDLARWVRAHRPGMAIKLAGGIEMAAETASKLCESGPHLKRPYDHQEVFDYLVQLRERRQS